MNDCLKAARKLPLVTLVEKTGIKIGKFFYKYNLEGQSMTTLITPHVLASLQEMEGKLPQMSIQEFGNVRCSVTILSLTSYT